MHFGVLGPLSVTGPAGPVDLGSRRGRALLAWLLLNADEQVSVTNTVSVLWPGPGPASARTRVQRMARELNAALGDDLIDVGAGLRLTVDAESTDEARFRRLADQADEELRDGRTEAALADLREAIGLWRGKPYPELDRALPAIGAIDWLTERYLGCVEARNALLLAGSVDFHLVADLRAAVTLNPERVRLQCQLALALYRTGRQLDALTTLREIVARTPHSGAAEALQTAILRHDPALSNGELPPS